MFPPDGFANSKKTNPPLTPRNVPDQARDVGARHQKREGEIVCLANTTTGDLL